LIGGVLHAKLDQAKKLVFLKDDARYLERLFAVLFFGLFVTTADKCEQDQQGHQVASKVVFIFQGRLRGIVVAQLPI
jgi:hypothetical protein|tara:strand:- start:14 stop:244 length:231 start_codon:yes stop_codon:yes gene_type:complete